MKDRDRCPVTEVRRSSTAGEITVRCVEPRKHNPRVQPHTWMGKAFRRRA